MKTMNLIFVIFGFLISSIIFGLCIYLGKKNLKTQLLNLLKINSKNYLKHFIKMANKNYLKFKNIISLIEIKFEKAYCNIEQLNLENCILKKTIDSVDDGILILDGKYTIYYLNEKLFSMFNLSESKDAVNRNLKDSNLNWILNFQNLKSFEIPNKYSKINLLCYVENIKNEFKIYKFKDISEYKKMDYMSREFVSNITHELKTPLTSIIGFSETLKNVEHEEDRQIFYDIINREAIRLNNLISDVLIFSDIESQNDITKQKINLCELIENIRQLLEPQLKEMNFKIEISNNKVVILNCEKYLHQIFMNIMDNSIKHSFGTFLKIECFEDNKNVYINFSDDGIGIPNEDVENIFNRFYKVPNSKSKTRGTGLGLSIVKSCIEKMNSEIFVFNNEDRGVTFKIIIPKR